MKRDIWKTAVVLGLSAMLFSGCDALNDTDLNEGSASYSYAGGSGGSGESSRNDSLAVVKTIDPDGFSVLWIKRASGYGEVIYTDDLSRKRGRGYPLTSNTTGSFSLKCEKGQYDDYGILFSCKPSNVTYTKRVYLEKGVEYKWLVSYGFDHEKGEVEATMTYIGNGEITIE